MLKFHDKDPARMALFPSLDYKGLYNVVVDLLDVAPLIQYGLQSKCNIKKKIIIINCTQREKVCGDMYFFVRLEFSLHMT